MALALPRATLRQLGGETLTLLKRVRAVGRDEDIIHSGWPSVLFEAEADRFELWAVNLGLFVPGHGSLDYRVREAESLEHTLRRFMKGLNDSLTEGRPSRT